MEENEEQTKVFNEIIIFGCGGVGSWIAEYIVRMKLTNRLILIDFDNVEPKNLNRQNYTILDNGISKVQALKTRLAMIQSRTGREEDMQVAIREQNKKINDEIDIITYNKDSLAILATDNVKSKQTIAKHFNRYLLINCDKNYVEIKNHLDTEENSAWDMGGGYNSNQDIISNINSAIMVTTIIKEMPDQTWTKNKFSFKVEPETELRNLINGNTKKRRNVSMGALFG